MAEREPDWEREDAFGDAVRIYSYPERKEVGIAIDEDADYGGAAAQWGLPRLRALIAELTRRAALLAGEAGEAPARTAEDERADVLALLTKVHGWAAERSSVGRVKAFEDAAYMIRHGAHVGVAAEVIPGEPATWAGPGYYAGRDADGRSVALNAATPTGLARIGAAAGVARWSGPHASLAAAGKALDAEGGQ